MGGHDELLDRAVPDRVETASLPPRVAAEVDHLAGRWAPWTGEDVAPGVRARALVDACQPDAARAVLAAIAGWDRPSEVAAALWAASRVGPAEVLDGLRVRVAELPDGFVVDDGVPLGPASLHRGLAAAAIGDLDDAVCSLRRAVIDGDRRAPIWGARARLELARVLWTVAALEGGPGAVHETGSAAAVEARRVQTAAGTFFRATGHAHLARQCAVLTEPVVDGTARPLLGHLVAHEGTWTVGFGVATTVEVPEAKGLVALGHLVRNRQRPVLAVELARVIDGEPVGDLDSLPRELVEQLDGAAAGSDELRALLIDEKARSRTTKLVRRTIARLAEVHPVLGRHLEARVTTGYACRYRGDDVVWET